MSGILRLAGATLAAVCAGIIIAQMLVLGLLWQTGRLDRARLADMLAIFEGRTPPSIAAAQPTAAASADMQLSLAEKAQSRAMRSLDFDLREQSLHNSLARLEAERIKLQDESERYKQLKASFDLELAELRKNVLGASEDNARQILENIRPKQAKDQLVRMIDAGEMDAVVALLSTMSVDTRAKIIGEFKTEDEAIKLAELLTAIREAHPEIDLIDQTTADLGGATL